MKLKKLVQVKGVFTPLIQTKLTPKLSYKILKFIRAIEFEERFFNEKLREIIDEYGKKGEDGKFLFDKDDNILIKEEKVEDCNKAIAELDELEVTPPAVRFTLDELENLSLSVVDMAIIEEFIVQEE